MAGAGRFEAAEPLLLECVETLTADEALPADARLWGEEPVARALAQAAELHEAWERAEPGGGHAAEAARFRDALRRRREE